MKVLFSSSSIDGVGNFSKKRSGSVDLIGEVVGYVGLDNDAYAVIVRDDEFYQRDIRNIRVASKEDILKDEQEVKYKTLRNHFIIANSSTFIDALFDPMKTMNIRTASREAKLYEILAEDDRLAIFNHLTKNDWIPWVSSDDYAVFSVMTIDDILKSMLQHSRNRSV